MDKLCLSVTSLKFSACTALNRGQAQRCLSEQSSAAAPRTIWQPLAFAAVHETAQPEGLNEAGNHSQRCGPTIQMPHECGHWLTCTGNCANSH